MALSEEHAQFLERGLISHELRLESLLSKIAQLKDEADAHRLLLALARDPALRASLGELADGPHLAEAAAREPASYFSERGLKLPEGTELRVALDEPSGAVSVEGTFGQGEFRFKVSWHSVEGFTAPVQVHPPR